MHLLHGDTVPVLKTSLLPGRQRQEHIHSIGSLKQFCFDGLRFIVLITMRNSSPLSIFASLNCFLIGVLFLAGADSFSPSSTAHKNIIQLSATKAPDSAPSTMAKDYTNEELQGALDSMLEGSTNADYDARHIFGYGQSDHKLSMLQIITATRILDYKDMMVRSCCS
jgi:hypothetical protein